MTRPRRGSIQSEFDLLDAIGEVSPCKDDLLVIATNSSPYRITTPMPANRHTSSSIGVTSVVILIAALTLVALAFFSGSGNDDPRPAAGTADHPPLAPPAADPGAGTGLDMLNAPQQLPRLEDFRHNMNTLKGDALQGYLRLNSELVSHLTDEELLQFVSGFPPGNELISVVGAVTVPLINADWRRGIRFLDQLEGIIPSDSLRSNKVWALKVALCSDEVSPSMAQAILNSDEYVIDISEGELAEMWTGIVFRNPERAVALLDIFPAEARRKALIDSPMLIESIGMKEKPMEASRLIHSVDDPGDAIQLSQRFGMSYANQLMTGQQTVESMNQQLLGFGAELPGKECRDAYLTSALSTVIKKDINMGLSLVSALEDRELRQEVIKGNMAFIERWDPEAAEKWRKEADISD